MHQLLHKLFAKLEIKDATQLSPDDKVTFSQWNAILSKQELTIGDIKEFCRIQIEVIEGKWRDLNLEQSKKAELIPYHTVYKALFTTIDSPIAAREAIERQLNQLLK